MYQLFSLTRIVLFQACIVQLAVCQGVQSFDTGTLAYGIYLLSFINYEIQLDTCILLQSDLETLQ